MIRQIIHIDEEKCNGCGLCATACHEGAIGMIDGKAKLLRDDFCDGMGDCLPNCPTGAITFEEKDTLAYDEEAVLEAKKRKEEIQKNAERMAEAHHAGGGCPGSRMMEFKRQEGAGGKSEGSTTASHAVGQVDSELRQWPVQIKLAPIKAPYFEGAKLLIAADCTAYAYAGFHRDFIRGRITLVGCPKLDDIDYSEKLTEIIRENDIKSVTIVRMEVPCCGGLEMAVKRAIQNSGKFLPWQVVTISTDGRILE